MRKVIKKLFNALSSDSVSDNWFLPLLVGAILSLLGSVVIVAFISFYWWDVSWVTWTRFRAIMCGTVLVVLAAMNS